MALQGFATGYDDQIQEEQELLEPRSRGQTEKEGKHRLRET